MSYSALGDTSTELRTRAREAYARGQEAFNTGNFQGALDNFLEAYRLYSLPTVLVAIAATYGKLGQREQAAQYAQRYLYADPGGDQAARARGILNAARPPTTPEVPSTLPESPIAPPAIEDAYAEHATYAVWAVAGAGVLGLVGLGYWLTRRSRVAANRRRRRSSRRR